jgi:hypothetical protein
MTDHAARAGQPELISRRPQLRTRSPHKLWAHARCGLMHVWLDHSFDWINYDKKLLSCLTWQANTKHYLLRTSFILTKDSSHMEGVNRSVLIGGPWAAGRLSCLLLLLLAAWSGDGRASVAAHNGWCAGLRCCEAVSKFFFTKFQGRDPPTL